jgi:hypothetical protein
MEFQIDYGSVPLTKKPAPPTGPLLASVDGRVNSLANGEVVFFDLGTEQLHVMTEQVLGAMDVCRPFRTLDEHVAAVRQAMPALPQQGDAVKRVLENLVSRGLIISDADWLARLAQHDARPQAEFAGLFIRACDRPAQVKRLLASLADYEKQFAPKHRYWLVDDSREAANGREHATLLADFARQAGVETRYIGAAEWSKLADAYAAGSEDGAAADWLLRREAARPHAGGLAMNLIALLAAGRRYALLDDDFVFPLRRHPDARDGVELAGGPQLPVRFFGSTDAALAAGADFESDPLQAHLDACGAPLGALLNHHPQLRLSRDDLVGVAPSLLPHLDRDRRIVATVNGHRGHSGTANAGWLFALDPKSREGFWATREDYLRTIESPSLWHGPARTRLQAQGNFTPFTVDGAEMLPFTRPSGRGEDRLFGAMCRFLAPASLTAHLPTSIGHRQETDRSRAGTLKQAFTPGLNDYLLDLAQVSAAEFHADDRATRLRGFAARLRDLAAAGDKAILGELREHLAHVRSSLVHSLHSVLQGSKGAPVYWQADLRQLIEANGKAMIAGGAPKLADWDALDDGAAVAARYREELAHYADALDAWPGLWTTAVARRGAA